MERDVEAITADLRKVCDDIVLYSRAGFKNHEAIGRFHVLHDEQKRAIRKQSPQWIYYVHAPSADRIKIGITRDLNRRFRGLCEASPVQLVLLAKAPGTPADERTLHRKWAHLRCNGEWFVAAPELLDIIDGAL